MVEGFKKSEVGVIPDDWDDKTLGTITTSIASGKSKTQSSIGGKFFIYGSTGVIGQSSKPDYDGKRILVARVGANAGTVNQVEGEYCVSDNTLMVQIKKQIDINYAFFFLKYSNLNKLIFGSGQPLITGTQLKHLSIPLPPSKAEQTAIATALNDADALINQLEHLLIKKRNIKTGAMQELLTPKEEWEEKYLTDCVDYIHGKAHEKNIDENGKFVVVNSKFISSDGKVVKYSNQNFCPAKQGDILTVLSDLPNGKALAKCFYVDEDKLFAVNQRICIWRSKGAFPKFLLYILNRNKYFIGLDDGISQTHILNHHIEKCKISIPTDKEEQIKIAQILSDMDIEIQGLERKLEKYKGLKQGMMQSLLSGKIRLV